MAALAKFFINSIMLGVGLAMDAFSVSLANGFAENKMNKRRMAFIAGIYADLRNPIRLAPECFLCRALPQL